MVRKKWKRLLTGIMCASLVLTEVMCMDVRSYAAEMGQTAVSQEDESRTEPDADEVKQGQSGNGENTGESEEEELEAEEAKETESESMEPKETKSGIIETEEDAEAAETETGTESGEDKDVQTSGEENRNSVPDDETEAVWGEEPVNDGADGADGSDGTDTVVPGISDSDLLATPKVQRWEQMKSVGNIVASGVSEKSDIVWTLDEDGKLTIVGTGEYETTKVQYSEDTSHDLLAADWYSHRARIKSAKVIVKNMENPAYMFAGCKELISVDLGGFDMDGVKNMSHMFFGCSQLENLDLSGLNTETVEDMSYLFGNCIKLTNLNLDNFKTQNVTDMSGMFYWCNGLVGLDLSHFNTQNVTNMSDMFTECKHMTSLDLSSFETGNVTNMSSMFAGLTSITGLDVSHFTTDNVTDMSSMFTHCDNLTDLDVSHFNTGNVTNMNRMFCAGVTNKISCLDVSNFDTGKVTDMGFMFFGCSELTALDVSKFDTNNVTDMSYMFEFCTSLKNLKLGSSFRTEKVTNIGGMFTECSSLVTLDLSSFDLSNADSLDFMKKDIGFLDKCTNLMAIFTPRNLKASVIAALPADGEDWYDKKGSLYTDLPAGEAESILIMRGQQADVTADSIVVQKAKTEYMCGDKIDTDDLAVIYFDENETPAIVKDYTTNADEIDMSTVGKKTLTVTYETGGKKLTADIELNVLNAVRVLSSDNVTVTLPSKTSYDYGYDGKPKEPDLTVVYQENGGEAVTLVKGTDYTVTYHNNVNAYEETLTRAVAEPPAAVIEGMGAYSGTVSVPFTIDKAAAPQGETLNAYIEQCETAKDGQTLDLSGCFENCGEKTGYEITEVKEDDTAAGNVFSKIPVTEDIDGEGILTYGTNAGEENDFAVIKIKVSFRNYRDGELTVKIGFAGKEPVQISGISMTDSVYNKRAVSYSGTAKVNSKEGEELTGEVTLTYSYRGIQADGTVYSASPNAPVHAGDYVLTVAVAEENEIYTGSAEYPFRIQKALVVITAKNVVLQAGEQAPASFSYAIRGLVGADVLKRQPDFTLRDGNGSIVGKPDTGKAGTYTIVPGNADAGADYTIRYQEGTLTIKRSGIDSIVGDIKPMVYTGSALKPEVQVYGSDGETLLKEGQDYTVSYRMNKDASALDGSGKPLEGGFKVTELHSGQSGSVEKVVVEEGFDETLPHIIVKGKGGFSGTIYKNFVIRRADISAQGSALADGFSMKYTEQAVKNDNKAQAVFGSLKYKKAMKLGTDYTVSLKADTDVQYDGNSALGEGEIPSMWFGETQQQGKGYSAPAIPQGYYGSFIMTVTGMGNYTGTVTKTIVVAKDAGHLVQKASVTLGASQKKVTGSTREKLERGITLQPGYYDVEEGQYYPVVDDDGSLGTAPEDKRNVFTVKCGGTYLIYGKDYTVAYSGNNAVGTASMTIIGKGEYTGSKKVTFQIAGEAFNTKTVRIEPYDENGTGKSGFRTKMPYTGKAVRQDNVLLTNGKEVGDQDYKEFVYGKDYTVSYKNNTNKGTATMIFTANPESGYSGSFKKTFRIEASELADTVRSQNEGRGVTVVRYTAAEEGKTGSIKSMSLTAPVSYAKGGVRPSVEEKVSLLRSDNRYALTEGKDYTVSYQYNTEVTTNSTKKKPVMIIKGKGNYKGTLKVEFTISKAALDELAEDAAFTAVQYKENRKADYEYKPAIKIMDGTKMLKAGSDYNVEYRYNTQAELSKCFDAGTGSVSGMTKAVAVITVPENSNYQISKENAETGIVIPLGDYIYQEKLVNNKNLYVVTSPAVYTGGQVKTEIRVYYGAREDIQKAKRTQERNNAKLTGTGEDGYHLKCFVKDKDYTLVWGTNRTAGKNKGSVKIVGKGMKYGGSVTVKFTIEKKSVYTKS
ncbi:MAG: BspA family leucine-rich repeat surface protein [Lachnospiraceae bacterium]|nr:BspA family leucine-rich repeat surface protein [Lachnospiraceae bacterium]